MARNKEMGIMLVLVWRINKGNDKFAPSFFYGMNADNSATREVVSEGTAGLVDMNEVNVVVECDGVENFEFEVDEPGIVAVIGTGGILVDIELLGMGRLDGVCGRGGIDGSVV